MLDFEKLMEQFVIQFPIAGAGIYIAKLYMNKHEMAISKLISTFESEVKGCEERYNKILDEVMRLKEKL